MECFKKIISYIFAIFMIVLALFLTIKEGEAYIKYDVDLLKINSVNIIFKFIMTIILFIVLYFIYNFVISSSKKLTIILLFISTVFGLFWIYNFPIKYYYDMNSIIDYAGFFLGGDIGEYVRYFVIYPFNISMGIVTSLFVRFFPYPDIFLAMRVVNVLLFLVTEIFVYKIVTLIANRKLANFVLFILLAYFPMTTYLSIIYNDVYAYSLLTIATYFFIKTVNYNSIFDLFLTVFFLIFGCYMRSVGYLFVIAFIVYYLLVDYKKSIKFILIIIITFFVFNSTVHNYYLEKYNIDNGNGVAINHYLYIGLNNGLNEKSPGYYKGDTLIDYMLENNYEFNGDEYNLYVTDILKEEIKSMNILDVVSHYSYKYLFQWSDGTLETNLINNIISDPDNTFVQFFYETKFSLAVKYTDSIQKFYKDYLNIFWYLIILIIALDSILSILKKNINNNRLLFKIIILGFIGFYILLETSPHYLMVVIPSLIIEFCFSFDDLINRSREFYNKKIKKI